MYIPRKGWQKWKKIIERNMVVSENGETTYKLGEMSWQRHCIIFGNLTNLHYELVAALFPITSFEKEFLVGWIYGNDDNYSFDMLDRHGYNILKKRDNYGRFSNSAERRSKILQNLLRKLESNGMVKKMEMELECRKLNAVKDMDDILYEWRDEFVFDE